MSMRWATVLVIIMLLLCIAVLLMNRSGQSYKQQMQRYRDLYEQADSTADALQQRFDSLEQHNSQLKEKELSLRQRAAGSDTIIQHIKQSYEDTYHHIDTFGAAEVQRFFTGYFARTDTL